MEDRICVPATSRSSAFSPKSDIRLADSTGLSGRNVVHSAIPGSRRIHKPVSARALAIRFGGWFTVLVFLVGLPSKPALAQSGNVQIELPNTYGEQSKPAPEPTPRIKLPTFLIGSGGKPTNAVKWMGPLFQYFTIKPPRLVVEDGAGYISFETPEVIPIPIYFSGEIIDIPTQWTATLVPLAGGGKSVCLNPGLSEPTIKIVTGYDKVQVQK